MFDSGTKTERSYTAVVAGADPIRDLAVLRVAGVKDPPPPITYADPPKVVETTTVYTFGFPFGKALATDRGNPAVTVGKASVSSLRTGSDGELAVIQIDGSLNPGNSGGPVVDVKGRLVGVAVATIRDGQGIGLTVPAAELGRMMQGRVGRVRILPQKKPDGKADGPITVRVEADLIDPANNLRGATAHYVHVAPKAKRPETDALDKHPGSKSLVLKIEKGTAIGEFTVSAAEGEVLVQVTADAAGQAVTSRVRAHPLAPKPNLAGPPPTGWKEYTPADKTFVAWLPAKPQRQADESRTLTVSGQRIRVTTVVGKTEDGLEYEAQSVILPPAFARVPRKDLYDLFRKAILAETKGRLTESIEAQMGALPGVEAVIEAGATVTRARIFLSGARAYIVQVTGAPDQVTGPEGETILSAFRLPGEVGKVPNAVAGGPPGKEPTIIAGGNNPQFKDLAPEGGLLIGLEIGLGKFGKDDVIQAVRPIYRVGDKEVLGMQRGTNLTRVVTVKAKDGYAVGAITCKFGLNFDGCSLTYMKVADGKLDAKDAYESEWVGYNGPKQPVKVGGDGTPVVGLAGRASDKALNGLGPLFKGQEAFEPKK